MTSKTVSYVNKHAMNKLSININKANFTRKFESTPYDKSSWHCSINERMLGTKQNV